MNVKVFQAGLDTLHTTFTSLTWYEIYPVIISVIWGSEIW